ncbi:MAG: SMC-Scp complex subunit ScpB [Clostridia bacterium]|nr:SMC-Scp complex subunit ScpB [Clostridia bacterium]
METVNKKGAIEAILFSVGRVVKAKELMNTLELSFDELSLLISEIQNEYKSSDRGIEIVRIEDGFTLASKKEYHDYIYPTIDKRIKPKLSQASLEVLSIIAYNQRATKADIDSIRGVDSGGSIYRLQEYNLIETAGKADLPGKPMTFRTTNNFLKMFGLKNIKELPKLPKYKFDSNRQIVIEDLEENE